MTDLIIPRRQFLAGLVAALAAPAIVRVDSLMKLPRPKLVKAFGFVDVKIGLNEIAVLPPQGVFIMTTKNLDPAFASGVMCDALDRIFFVEKVLPNGFMQLRSR